MKKLAWAAVVAVILGGAYVASQYFSQTSVDAPAPQVAVAPPPPLTQAPPPSEPAILHPLDVTPASPPLPLLSQSDQPILNALGELIGKNSLALLLSDGVIHRIVTTVDNLPRQQLPAKIRPLRSAPGAFAVEGDGESLTISPRNAARYTGYVKLASTIDTTGLVQLYRRYYPLFQQEYESLGYSRGYFNDRLVAAIDDLLAAPDPESPIRLSQPKVLYEFADPDLQGRSAGQKIMIRMGHDNAVRIKTWLRELRQEMTQGKLG